MSVASVDEEQELQRDPPCQNGTSNGSRTGGSPSKGAVELPFGPGNDILSQPTSPPHNYRHSRAYRHFKNPPQPHMCIRVTTVAGEEVFINVLSWTRIVVPQEPTDPIPLYGGMKVQPGSPRCPPLVYAVMANPEVLKDSGRHSKDPEERRAMVELMCDFVEAMNPDLRLNRNAVILKDRDISGELKDVWNAVQAQRDREREEQIIQQHTHVPPPQQLFPPQRQDPLQFDSLQQQQVNPNVTRNSPQTPQIIDNKITYIEFGAETACLQNTTNHSEELNCSENGNPPVSVVQSAITNKNANNLKPSVNETKERLEVDAGEVKNGCDQTDSALSSMKSGAKDQPASNNAVGNSSLSNLSPTNESQTAAKTSNSAEVVTASTSNLDKPKVATSPVSPTSAPSSSIIIGTAVATSSTAATTAASASTTTTTTSTKKEKLGGFLPNSCIFPRFKNKNKDKNKEKEKDKDKDKEKSSSHHNGKEKNLLNSFKKTTTAATNAFTKSHTHNEDSSATAMKNCLNLETEVEKLDLNKMDAPHANEVLIKVATPAAK